MVEFIGHEKFGVAVRFDAEVAVRMTVINAPDKCPSLDVKRFQSAAPRHAIPRPLHDEITSERRYTNPVRFDDAPFGVRRTGSSVKRIERNLRAECIRF